MEDYSKAPQGENTVRQLIDKETGEVFNVLSLITNRSGETLITATTELSPVITGGIKKKWSAPPYNCMYPEFRRIVMDGELTLSELRVLFFLLDNMPWGNRIHVSQRVIADSLDMARPNVSRVIKSLIEKEIIVDDVDPLIPNVSVYYVDPALAFNGSREERDFKRKAFAKKFKQAATKRA